jgi:hypothetical protein
MTKAHQIRITTWPGGPVPIPAVEVNPDVRVRGEFLYFGRSIALPEPTPVVPPDQMYLFEFEDLDLSDVDAVAAFCRRYGRIAPERLDEDLPEWLYMTRDIFIHSRERYGRNYESAKERFGRPEVHVDEFTYRVRIIRQLSRHVQAHMRGEGVADSWPDCPDDEAAWHRFARFVNAALSPFRVRVEMGAFTPSLPEVALYSVAVLQMVNDLSEHVDIKVCAAEKCGRTFVRQRGRSSNYSRTKGVMYCSDTCANSQAQREWRRRQRAKNNDQKGHAT